MSLRWQTIDVKELNALMPASNYFHYMCSYIKLLPHSFPCCSHIEFHIFTLIFASHISTSAVTATKSTLMPPYVWCAPFPLWSTQNVGHLFRGGPHIFDISLRLSNTEYTQKRGFSAFWIQSDLCLQMQLFDDVSRERKCFDSNSNLCIFLIKDKRRIKVLNTNYKEKKQKCDIQFLSRYIISIEPTKIKFYSAHMINQFCPLP